MAVMDEVCRKVLDNTEWISIVTCCENEPHVVGTLGDYVRNIGIREDEET